MLRNLIYDLCDMNFMSKIVILDSEKAVINPVASFNPAAPLKTCRFHLGQFQGCKRVKEKL